MASNKETPDLIICGSKKERKNKQNKKQKFVKSVTYVKTLTIHHHHCPIWRSLNPLTTQKRMRVRHKMKWKHNASRACVIYGDPATPTSESLAIAELASHSSGEGASDSGGLRLDSILGCYRLRQGGEYVPEAWSSGNSSSDNVSRSNKRSAAGKVSITLYCRERNRC